MCFLFNLCRLLFNFPLKVQSVNLRLSMWSQNTEILHLTWLFVPLLLTFTCNAMAGRSPLKKLSTVQVLCFFIDLRWWLEVNQTLNGFFLSAVVLVEILYSTSSFVCDEYEFPLHLKWIFLLDLLLEGFLLLKRFYLTHSNINLNFCIKITPRKKKGSNFLSL